MHHKMKLQPKLFEKIRSGTKTIESRLYDEKRRRISVGDTIEFLKEPEQQDTLAVKVVELLHYDSFDALMSSVSPHYFGGKTKKELLNEIYSFYAKEDEQKYGVLGIRIEIESLTAKSMCVTVFVK